MKNITTIIFLLIHAGAIAQLTPKESQILMASGLTTKASDFRKHYHNACYVYKTSSDYYKNNPIPNMDWNIWNSGSKIEVVRNGKTEKVTPGELGDPWFSDQNGLLVRVVKKNLYRVLVDGPMCAYVEVGNGEVYKDTDSTFQFYPTPDTHKFFAYYSMTLNGDLKSWSDKVFENYLKDFGWLQEYKSESVERNVSDSVWDVESRKVNKKLRYLRRVNTKLAGK